MLPFLRFSAKNRPARPVFNSLYATDGISAPNHDTTLRGRDAIVAWQATSFSQFAFKMDLTAEETRAMGDFGFDRGSYRMTATPKAGGDPIPQEGVRM